MKTTVTAIFALTIGFTSPRAAEAFAYTNSGPCLPSVCTGTLIQSYGTTGYGKPSVSPGFLVNAQTAWFPEQFGMFARADANTTGNSGGATSYASGFLFEPVLIPAQAGMNDGDAGVFAPHFHVEGSVNIDWSGFNVPGSGVVGGGVDFIFQVATFNNPVGSGGATFIDTFLDERWRSDHLTVQVDQDFTALIPFRFGEVFYFQEFVQLSAQVFSANPPSVGFAQGDFLHTGKLTGTTIFDKDGNPLANPFIDSGINFINPNTSAVPVPSSILLLGTALVGVGGLRKKLFRRSCS